MNKKGFSLVELLGVIVILMVIVLMATSGYRLVSRKVKETTYDNKVSNIEIKAVEYASSTGKKTMSVDQLVKEGLITADDSEGNVINPVNGNSMNCHLVYITEDSGNLYGNYTDQEECNTENLVVENLYLKINAYKANGANEMTNEIITEEWVRSNVVLVAEILNENINPANVTKIIWKTNVGREEREISGDYTSKNKYLVTAEQIVNSTYGVEIIMNDGTTYQAEKAVKIDKQRPIIYDSETRIEKENDWAKEKEVTIKATDGNGSGIYGYSIGTSNDCVHASYTEYKDNVYRKSITENGTYYVCVRDNAGNVSEDESHNSFTIDKIDKIVPSCVWSGESGSWSNQSRTISLGCSDTDSGCTLQNIITKTYDSNITTDRWRYEISDYAGNKTVCEKDVSVYIDKTAPICVWSGESNEWTSGDRTISLSCSDTDSGCQTSPINKTYSSSIGTEHWRYEIQDIAGNKTVCEKDVSVRIDKNPPSCWNGGDLALGNGDYNFTNHIGVSWGISGTGSVSCNPSNSLGTGSYHVSCSAVGNNGLTCNNAFTVRHSYEASYWVENRHDMKPCSCCTPHDSSDGNSDDYNCNYTHEINCSCIDYSKTYPVYHYYCPNGGTLNEADNYCYY